MFLFFKKKKSFPKSITGVKTILSAAHRDQKTGQIHGHTWEIVAWFNYKHDQSICKHSLNAVVQPLDHTCLPDDIAWGEKLAQYILHEINDDWDAPWCIAVDVNRPSEGIFARYEL